LPGMAEELVRLPVDVIVADGGAVLAAQEATRTIPIIGPVGPDPIATGLIRSLLRKTDLCETDRYTAEQGVGRVPAHPALFVMATGG
jgi:hypothetical protein